MPESKLENFEEAVSWIKSQIPEKSDRTFLVAVDGRCGSGKTEFARFLSKRIGASVIHMDDYFLPAVLRTPQRLSEPGGNIDYERFKAQVLVPLVSRNYYIKQRFNCSSMDLDQPRIVQAPKILIVEGTYSLHPKFIDSYSLKLFLDCDPSIQLKRLRARESEESLEKFLTRWIPLEEHYFNSLRIRNESDSVLDTSSLF